MKQYEVDIEIKDKKGVHYVFSWEGNINRRPTKEMTLYIEAKDEADLYEAIMKISKNTLNILRFEEITEGEMNSIDDFSNLVSNILKPDQALSLTLQVPIQTMCNN